MVKVVRFHNLGSADVLKVEELPLEFPKAGEVRLKILAFGLNRSEIQMRDGSYPMSNAAFPSKLGKEAVGEIEEIGEGVDGFNPGERVTTIPCFDMSKYGVYGESAVVPAFSLAKPPENLSDIEATAIWQQYLTAYGPLSLYSDLHPDNFVLITAATSSVGVGAIQMSKMFGAKVIATTRSSSKTDALLEIGADYTVVTSEENLVETVNRITGGNGVDLIFDPISGSIVDEFFDCLAHRGSIFLYGQLDKQPIVYPLVKAMKKGAVLQGYTLWELVNDSHLKERSVNDIRNWLAEGKLKPVVDRVFSLNEIVQAHEYMESNQQIGKIVVNVASLG